MPIANIGTALEYRIAALQDLHPGVGLDERSGEWRLTIPDSLRLGHDAHFTHLTRRFFDYVGHRQSLPQWERPNMLAKYYVCTEGVVLSRGESSAAAVRLRADATQRAGTRGDA